MALWFYILDGQQHGPVEEEEIADMITSGKLSLDGLVWTDGLPQWTVLRDIENFVPQDSLPPPIVQPPPMPRGGFIPSGPQARPWVRFFARTIDMFLFSMFAGFILGIVYESASKLNDYALGFIFTFGYIFVEPIMLSTWGTTPGKALLNVRLRGQDGDKLSYSDGMNRAFQVWLKGLGAGIPIVALFTQVAAYNRLRNEGKTTWDRDGHFLYSHQDISPVRIMGTVLVFVGFAVLFVLGKSAS